jgi:serine protease Do
MLVEPLTPQLLVRMGLPQATTGLLITDVDPAGTAADSGLQSGDVITRANDIEIRSVPDLNKAIAARRDRPALLLVTRTGTGLFVALKPGVTHTRAGTAS